MKKIMFGFLLGVTCMLTATAFAETQMSIDVIFDRVKLVVNGKPTNTSTLLYNGRTYVQLQGAADAFGAKLNWDQNTNTATLTSEQKVTQAPISTPIPTPTPTPSTSQDPTTPITIDQISYNLKLLPPDAIGTIYMETAFKNNSKYVLESIDMTFIDIKTNQKTHLSCFESILPGETSAIFDTFGPTSMKLSDMKLLETNITITTDSGESILIIYDHETKKYKVI